MPKKLSTNPTGEVCTKCGQHRCIDDFYKDSRWRKGHRSECKFCTDENNRQYSRTKVKQLTTYRNAYYKQNINRKKDYDMKRRYGIGLLEYGDILNKQNGKCAICLKEYGPEKMLAIDHNHITGKVRGLLCDNCNLGLGKFKEDSELLINAINYLNSYD